MDKQEYRVRTEKMLEYHGEKAYRQAKDIADTIDWRKVKNVPMLCVVSEIYEMNAECERAQEILFHAYDRSPESKKVIYRMAIVALKLGQIDEAADCYDEFVKLAPKDPNRYVLKYKILKAQKAPLDAQIETLEEFKKVEYVEKWAYELAKLYEAAGKTTECTEECDDLILWFSDGKYVYKAMDLKMKYKALTPLQQEKYNLQFVKVEEPATKEIAVEEAIIEEAIIEEAVIEEAVIKEPEAEQAVEENKDMQDNKDLEVTEDIEAKKETPTLSIGDMLQEWEEKQKENAEMIRAEIEKAEQEKAELEKAEKEKAEAQPAEEETILSDDIRQLIESLEKESIVIEAQKIRQEESEEAESKPLIQKVAEQLATIDIKETFAPKTPVAPVPEINVIPTNDMVSDVPEIMKRAETEKKAGSIQEMGGVKLGDTQSMAAVAKALKNNVEMEISEEEETLEEKEHYARNSQETGFVVTGRYDLEAQSAMKEGLTEEQKKLFSYFVPVHGMSEQIVKVLQQDKKCKARYGTSRIGNLVIIGRKGSGKTVLAVDVVKAIQKARKVKQGKVGIVTAESLNKKDVRNIVSKLQGGAIIIEKASRLNRKTVEVLCEIMEGQTGEMLVVLEDERKPMEKLMAAFPQFEKKFTSRLELPVFISDELVTFGQTYAKENGYKIDEMGILALYSRIDILQREEKVVTVTDVKEIIDEAIENSQKVSFKKFVKKIFGKHADDSDRIILKEEDFY